MTDLIPRLMSLWSGPPESDAEAEAAFAGLYTQPVLINGTPFGPADLLARARTLNAAFSGLRHELLDRVEAAGKIVIVFVMYGTHTGPFPTPVGVVPATGREIAVRTIDVLTLTPAGLVSEVSVLSDELGLLSSLGALDRFTLDI